MFCALKNSPRHCNGLSQGRVSPQVVFSRVSHLAIGDKIGLLKILENHADEMVVQHLAVSAAECRTQLRYGLTFDLEVTNSAQRDVTVGLHSHGLGELWVEFKRCLEYISGLQFVACVPRLKSLVCRGRRNGICFRLLNSCRDGLFLSYGKTGQKYESH